MGLNFHVHPKYHFHLQSGYFDRYTRSKKRGDDFILCDINNQIVKKISVEDSFNELSYAEFGEEFLGKEKNLD